MRLHKCVASQGFVCLYDLEMFIYSWREQQEDLLREMPVYLWGVVKLESLTR